MHFKTVYGFFYFFLFLLVAACSDADKEKALVDLFTTASQDLISISFPAATETLISIDTFVDYEIEGLKTNGVDVVPVSSDIVWSLSDGAVSTIDQSGRLRSGPVAELVTITAKFGILTATQDVTISAAKFDQVIQLNVTPVTIGLCQAQTLQPVGSYLNDDGSEEIRTVDNTVINTITWLVRNQEDDSPSQRALIKTVNSIVQLQALEAGNVIIQAQAKSLSSGSIVTSSDFNQVLNNSMNSFKLCQSTTTDLTTCTLDSVDIIENSLVSVISVANFQASNGSSFYQNISELSKWGTDSTNNVSLAFSADRQQINVTGNITGTTANISAACGKIVEPVLDSEIKNGVALDVPVTCAIGNLDCLTNTAAVNVTSKTVTSLTVTANNLALVDDTALVLASRPNAITLNVTANYSDNSIQDITADTNIIYNNRSVLVAIAISGSPGEYTVLRAGNVDIQVIFQGQIFIVKVTVP